MSDLTVVHSSDLHIDPPKADAADSFHPLCRVIATAQAVGADVLLLAGDVFDHNRLPLALLDRAARTLADAGIPIIILPGNHDCLGPGSVYRRGGLADVPNVHVIGVTVEEAVALPGHDLEVWGRAHYDYRNMSPLARPRSRRAGRQIAMAHGHWLRDRADEQRAWLITSEQIAATGADYVALGHWPQAVPAGDGAVPAYYSGAPDLAGSVNVVRFADGLARVDRAPLVQPGGAV